MAEDTGDTYVVGAEEPGEDEEPPLIYEDDAANLVPIFEGHTEGREFLDDIEQRVLSDFDTDWSSTQEHRERRAADWKLFAGELTPKDHPWEDSANGHVPIVLENISRLQARVYSEIFMGSGPVFGVKPVGPDDEEMARLLSHHGNWQIRNEIPDFFNQQHRGLLMFFLWGDVVCHSTYDLDRRQNHHEMLSCDEFVVPYTYCSTQPDFSDCPHRTRIRYMARHEIEAYKGIWSNIDITLERKPAFSDGPDTLFADSVNEVDSIIKPEDSTAAPYKILEYEGWLDLPNQTRQRFCRVILDEHTQNIMLLEIREAPDWRERIRYQMENDQLEQYKAALKQWQLGKETTLMAQAQLLTDEEMQAPDKADVMQQMAGMEEMPPPTPPGWMSNSMDLEERPRRMRMSPIQMFSHGVCIDNLAGNLGLGIGRIEADLNIAADTILNQFIDASTIQNCGSWLVHSSVQFDQPFEIAPGKVNYVDGIEMGALNANIMSAPRMNANPAMMDLVHKLEEWGSKAIQAPAVLSGEAGKSGETARGLTARIEQATKQTSVVAGRYADFTTQVLKNNGHLNSVFMPKEEFFMVNNHMGEPEMLQAGREMYRPNYAVSITSNLKFTTQSAKTEAANDTLSLVMNIPHLAQNPALVYEAVVGVLQATEQEDMIPKLGAPPPPTEQFGPPPPPPMEGEGGPPQTPSPQG